MDYLGESLKYLPFNLKYLVLILVFNNLESSSENIRHLCEGLKKLPNKLHYLELNLEYNDLGTNP